MAIFVQVPGTISGGIFESDGTRPPFRRPTIMLYGEITILDHHVSGKDHPSYPHSDTVYSIVTLGSQCIGLPPVPVNINKRLFTSSPLAFDKESSPFWQAISGSQAYSSQVQIAAAGINDMIAIRNMGKHLLHRSYNGSLLIPLVYPWSLGCCVVRESVSGGAGNNSRIFCSNCPTLGFILSRLSKITINKAGTKYICI